MTMPRLMNCPHQGDGWCLDCVRRHGAEMPSPDPTNPEWQPNDLILDWLDTPYGRRLRMGFEYGYWYSSFPEDNGVRQAKTFRELIQQRMRPNAESSDGAGRKDKS